MLSLATQTLVIHVIRTKKTPLIQSRASKLLIASSLLAVVFGWALPYTPLGAIFRFAPLPLHIVLTLGGIVLAYLITVEFAKRWFYKRVDF